MKSIKLLLSFVLLLGLTFSSCKTMTKSQKGAVIGAAGGAVVGGAIGAAAGNTAVGAVIGAAVGGTAGAIIGAKMDRQAEEIAKEVPNAKVERVGEGIVVEFDSNVLFGFNQSNLTSTAQNTLNDLITILTKYPDTNIEIHGHTDNIGSNEYNQQLSEKRATSVAGYLSSHGIAYTRIKTKGFGETFPKYSNDTESGRAQNRRVEFVITANEKMKAEAQKEAGTE